MYLNNTLTPHWAHLSTFDTSPHTSSVLPHGYLVQSQQSVCLTATIGTPLASFFFNRSDFTSLGQGFFVFQSRERFSNFFRNESTISNHL
jgi:hypothetical protein